MKEYIRYQLNKIEMCCEYTYIYIKSFIISYTLIIVDYS